MTTEPREIGPCHKRYCGGTVYRQETSWWITQACNRCGKGWGSSLSGALSVLREDET